MLSQVNLGPIRAFNILKSLYGGYEEARETKNDFKNFKMRQNAYISEYDADMVIKCLEKKNKYCPNFSFDYSIKEDGTLGGLFWVSEDSKRNYMAFGDVVGFDATYRSKKYDMVFVSFTFIDNHNRNITFGVALLGFETANSYNWLLMSYVQVFGYAPKVVVTDQDVAIKDALPNRRHRLCMWHIWEKMTSKIGLATSNIKEFKKNWLRLCGHILLHAENLSGLMRTTTSRSESENHCFNQFCNPKSTLVEFFSHFEAEIVGQRYEHRRNYHESQHIDPEIWNPSFVLESQAAKIFT